MDMIKRKKSFLLSIPPLFLSGPAFAAPVQTLLQEDFQEVSVASATTVVTIATIGSSLDGNPATSANGGTIGIAAASRDHVLAWHQAGTSHGGTAIESPPSERPNGAFVAYLRDPDGNKLTARSQARN